MTKIIESYAGNTEQVLELRNQINTALKNQDLVKVKLWQPGIMYQQDNKWMTVIDFINEWQDRPVVFYSNLVPLRKASCEFHYTNDMFISGHKLYEDNKLCKSLLQQLTPIENDRRYHWDFLFGQHKPLKDELYEKLLSHPIETRVFHTYFKHNPKDGIWSHGHVPKNHSAETIDGNENPYDNPVRHSDLIDLEIYNNSYYSVAIETVIHNDFAMFSEKEAKPIMAKRPFVVMGAKHQMKAFRSLGFKTFSPIIDESYDEIEDAEERFEAIMLCMQKLCEQNPKAVYRKLEHVLEHNKKHFIETRWPNV